MRTTPRRSAFLLALLLPGPATAAEAFGEAVYYLGDLHAHTGYSGDAGSADLGNCTGSCGDLADVFETARDNDLDFVAIADHVNGNSQASTEDYAALTAAIIAANDPDGGFVTIPAAEVWFSLVDGRTRLGHKTLLVFGDDTTLADLTIDDMRVDQTGLVTDCAQIWTWMETLSTGFGPAILVPHHTAADRPMPTDWSCHSPTWEPAVEVYSEHGSSLDESGYDPIGEGTISSGTAASAMDPDGYALTLGFVGGTDSHDTRPGETCGLDTEHPTHLYGGGLTIAMLDVGETFDRAAVHTAIVARRTYVTTGPMLPLAVTWSTAGVPLGGLGEALDAPVSLDLDLVVTLPADRAAHVTSVMAVGPDAGWTLTDDGAGAWSGSVPAGDVPAWLYVAVQIDGAAWYADDGGCPDGGDDVEWLWTSPSPITLWEDDTDGDGWSIVTGDCDDGDATVNPEAEEVWYDGVDQDCDDASDYDQDGDGYRAEVGDGEDCDDTSADVSPGATETFYDGVDQDCDGASDWDADGDGYDTSAWGGTDCDDAEVTVSPGATEVWYDGVDQDCDGGRDDDADGDGFPVPLDCFDADPDRWACPAVRSAGDTSGCVTSPGTPSIWLLGVGAFLALGARARSGTSDLQRRRGSRRSTPAGRPPPFE